MMSSGGTAGSQPFDLVVSIRLIAKKVLAPRPQNLQHEANQSAGESSSKSVKKAKGLMGISNQFRGWRRAKGGENICFGQMCSLLMIHLPVTTRISFFPSLPTGAGARIKLN